MKRLGLVSIVIVGYNSGHILSDCLEQIRDSDDLEFILVDNNSSDDTVSVFENAVPGGKVVKRSSNGGFAVAVNEGVRASTGEYILMLNPDAVVCYEQIARLRSILQLDDRAAIAGPVVGSAALGQATVTAGRFPTLFRMFLHQSGLARLSKYSKAFEGHYLMSNALNSGVRNVDWVTGGCMMVTHTAWESLGGLSERWFMYAEDIEFCWRASAQNFQCKLDLEQVVEHSIGGSSKGVDGRANPAWIVNLLDFYRTSVAPNRASVMLWKAIVISGFSGRFLAYMIIAVTKGRGSRMARSSAWRYLNYSRAVIKG